MCIDFFKNNFDHKVLEEKKIISNQDPAFFRGLGPDPGKLHPDLQHRFFGSNKRAAPVLYYE